jgi:hypothetical protein
MAQPDLPAPLAVAYTDAELVVSEQLRRRKDDLGRRMVNQYVLEKRIGKGQHGIVYRAEVSQGDGRTVRAVAIKMVMRNDKHEDRMRMLRHNNRPIPRDGNHLPLTARLGSHENKIRKEIAIMKKCKNAHIVRLLEVIDDKTNKKIYMGAWPSVPPISSILTTYASHGVHGRWRNQVERHQRAPYPHRRPNSSYHPRRRPRHRVPYVRFAVVLLLLELRTHQYTTMVSSTATSNLPTSSGRPTASVSRSPTLACPTSPTPNPSATSQS